MQTLRTKPKPTQNASLMGHTLYPNLKTLSEIVIIERHKDTGMVIQLRAQVTSSSQILTI